VVASDLKRPSGLAFSPDYHALYVSELGEGHSGLYIHAYDITYSVAFKVSSSNKSVVSSVRQTATRSSDFAPGSSTQFSTQNQQGQSYATPDSSPRLRAAGLVERSLSRSRSSSQARTHDMSNHRSLALMPNGIRPHSQRATIESGLLTPTLSSARLVPSTNRRSSTFLSSKRLVVYTPNAVTSGAITTDPVQGDLWLGTEYGVEVWNAGTGELTGKILIEEWDARHTDEKRPKMRGVSKVVFTSDGEALLLGGERIWQLKMGLRTDAQPIML
jgi:hypothetical protein